MLHLGTSAVQHEMESMQKPGQTHCCNLVFLLGGTDLRNKRLQHVLLHCLPNGVVKVADPRKPKIEAGLQPT